MQIANGAVLTRWGTLSDEEIVVRVCDGQTALFEVLMRRHNERIYRAARAILRDDLEAEDVMQQAYVNAYAHLRQFDRRAAFATWLTRIAVNEAITRLRRRGRYTPMETDDSATADQTRGVSAPPTPEHAAYANELRHLLEAAVDRLPDGSREVFVLREVQGLTTTETAQVLGIADDAVKTRLSRAKRTLRQALTAALGDAGRGAFAFEQTRCDRIVAAVFARIG